MCELLIDNARDDDCYELTLSGELSVLTVDELTERALAALGDRAVRALVVDLAAVSFIDSTGLSALVSLQATCADLGTRLILRSPTPRIIELLRLIHMDSVFTVDPPIPQCRTD